MGALVVLVDFEGLGGRWRVVLKVSFRSGQANNWSVRT